jgi:hypothetical protein
MLVIAFAAWGLCGATGFLTAEYFGTTGPGRVIGLVLATPFLIGLFLMLVNLWLVGMGHSMPHFLMQVFLRPRLQLLNRRGLVRATFRK